MLDTPIFRALGPDRHRSPTGLSSAALSGKKGLPIRMPDRSAAPFVHGTIPDGRIPVQSSFELRRCPERVRSTYSLSRPPRSDVGRSPPFPCGGPHSPEKRAGIGFGPDSHPPILFSIPARGSRAGRSFRGEGPPSVRAGSADCGLASHRRKAPNRVRSGREEHFGRSPPRTWRRRPSRAACSAGRIPILRGGGKICRNGRENDVARGLRPHAQAGKRPKPFVRRAETDETPIRSRNKSRSARIVRCARRGPSEAIGTHFFFLSLHFHRAKPQERQVIC